MLKQHRTDLADADIPVSLDPGNDPDTGPLLQYLATEIRGLTGHIEILRFTGGHANLAYLIRTPDREYVLKREPAGAKARSAHDMRREFHIISRLADIYPFAPIPVLLCEDESVFGGVFCLMERIRGVIVRTAGARERSDPAMHARRFVSLIDALAQLHRVDVESAGLGDFGRPNGYRERQVEGWCRRFEEAGAQASAPAADVTAWLRASIPSTPQAKAVVHNDFKMDNLVWDQRVADRLVGVLDWEMATVGDPLMDLACTLSFWTEPGDPARLRSLRAMPSDLPGVSSREDALERYASQTGVGIGDFRFYRCFGLFRRAAIEQQKFHRFVTHQTADMRYAKLDEAVRILLDGCRAVISS